MQEAEQHRLAYQAVMDVLPDSEWISHEDSANLDWDRPEVRMIIPINGNGPLTGCPECGEPYSQPGLVRRCKETHEPAE